jgi:hypothetical protein
MTTDLLEFNQELQVLRQTCERNKKEFEEYEAQFEKARKSLFSYLKEADIQGKTSFFSDWMARYFELEGLFFGHTPQNAQLGSELETAIRAVIKKRFSNSVSPDFAESHRQTEFDLGRMEIAINAGKRKVFVQVKRGFDGTAWKRILQEKEAIEKKENLYLLVSPTEYTNEEIRSEIREKHLWKWVFLWKENCWRTPVYDDWMERFLDVLGNSLE